MADQEKKKPKPPKGVPRGGARFPRHGLKEVIPWATKLVSKTHSGPQTAEIIQASVVNTKGVRGEIKISALRQYGLLDGVKDAIIATDLAKAIAFGTEEELPALYGQAALTPIVFKGLFDTFNGDDVPITRLVKRAVDLKIHPDNASDCVETYVESLGLAGLVTVEGDKVIHKPAKSPSPSQETELEAASKEADDSDAEHPPETDRSTTAELQEVVPKGTPRAVFNVTVNLDSSLDTEKLEKQLALLKKFGAI